MPDITIKQLAEYCRDYIDLVSPQIIARGGKRVRLDSLFFSAKSLMTNVAEINYEDPIVLPINLSTKLSDLSAENEEADSDSDNFVERELEIARNLDDIRRKLDTNSYTKQLSLQFGRISFKGIPIFKDDELELEENKHKYVEGYLFTIPIFLDYKDSNGKRSYEVRIEDTLIKTNVGFVKNFMKIEYRDELHKFIAIEADEEKASIPIDPKYIDELWSKIVTYLKYSNAVDISESPDLTDVVVALEPKANYFLSQDLTGIILTANDEALGETSLSSWTDKNDDQDVTESIDESGQHEIFFPFAYDKYQLQVLSKINNKGLIVEGPPGTGKSQTIANILVHLAATSKKVLFVSQKDQAVRGVKDKLKSLDIPLLYGYMPDRSSRLHTEEDERDSAAYALRGISRVSLNNVEEQDPKLFLASISEKIPNFNSAIDESRTFVKIHSEWMSLDEFEFGADMTEITIEWYDSIQNIREIIETTKIQIAKQKNKLVINGQNVDLLKQNQENLNDKFQNERTLFKDAFANLWLENEQQYIYGISYKLLSNLTHEIIEAFETNVIDRRINIISAKLNNIKLSKELDRTLKQLPVELFNLYKSIVFSNETKTERRMKLEKIEDYFLLMAQIQDDLNKASEKLTLIEANRETLQKDVIALESVLGDNNAQLNSKRLDDISMGRIDDLYKKYESSLFEKISRRHSLDAEVKGIINVNSNGIREAIMREKETYDSQVKNYISNRIAQRARSLQSNRQNRASLENIARSLSKTKKAYKTFDRLKSEPINFEAMSAVTQIWMMGLDDASRILPLQMNLFDYVIIDEASQCNIAYTFPVMYRAKHTIFFGDTLQMRDSTISFKSNAELTSLANKHNIPDNFQIKANGDSVKSVMDIAKLAGFKTTNLMKHYRSPIELIGFSNENFYAPEGRRLEVVNDDILATEDGRVMKTHLLKSNPDVEISSKTNLTEAYFIKKLIGKIKSNDITKNKSVAVLSFFNEQVELIRKIIPDEDVKVSAIEGIQGDERDIIIYSFVITSPNDKNRYSPLTGETGEIRKGINQGRVNVAFSRARLQVHAVTSLDPNLWPDGIWIKKYLQYIEKHGRVSRLTKANQHFDSHFEEEIYDYFMQSLDLNDYYISTQVESCGFKIDQVISNIKTGKKLAIECDGPTHFDDGDGQVRVDSDFERQFVLETAHWTFYRISYIDWHKNKQNTKKDIRKAITEHFSCREKAIADNDILINNEVEYETTVVEIPAEIISNIKEQNISKSTRNCFGRSAAPKKSNAMVKNNDDLDINCTEESVLNQIDEADIIKSSSTEDFRQMSIDQLDMMSNNLSGKDIHGSKIEVLAPTPDILIQSKDGNNEIEDIISSIKMAEILFVDKRSKGGALWLVGGMELSDFVKECKVKGFLFKFKLGGGHATSGKDAWWVK